MQWNRQWRQGAKAGFIDSGWTITPDGERMRIFRRAVQSAKLAR